MCKFYCIREFYDFMKLLAGRATADRPGLGYATSVHANGAFNADFRGGEFVYHLTNVSRGNRGATPSNR
jgi:hypothetical protein